MSSDDVAEEWAELVAADKTTVLSWYQFCGVMQLSLGELSKLSNMPTASLAGELVAC